MILSVASGKGGTGKTTVAVNLALSLTDEHSVQFLDCDVEDPNAGIFLKPQIIQNQSVFFPVPEVIEAKCTYCGKCAEVCAYNALAVLKDNVLVFPELCHGCGGCSLLCLEDAIQMETNISGEWYVSQTKYGSLVHAKLGIGEEKSGKLVTEVRKKAKENEENMA